MPRTITLLYLVFSACDPKGVIIEGEMLGDGQDTSAGQTIEDSGEPEVVDADGDGHPIGEDCDDENATVYPGADELCDELDNDCDLEVDEDPIDLTDWYPDQDSDGFGAGEPIIEACTAPEAHTDIPGDCDDLNEGIHPLAEEICEDGVDNNCDGSADPCTLSGIIPVDDAGATIAGHRIYQQVGFVASSAGDLNGDGLGDFIIGQPMSDDFTYEAGAAYVFLAPLATDGTLMDADAILLGEDIEHHAASAIASIGDINGDEYDDLLIGNPDQPGNAALSGVVHVKYGPLMGDISLSTSEHRFLGEDAGDHAGRSVALLGDTNGDGVPELGIGAPNADIGEGPNGAVYIVTPDAEGTENLASSEAILHGIYANEAAGYSIQGNEDVNGDGYADMVVGAPMRTSDGGALHGGGAYVAYGPFSSRSLADSGSTLHGLGLTADANLGNSTAMLGDVDGDNKGEIALGCLNCNRAFVFFGEIAPSMDISEAGASWSGEEPEDLAGWVVNRADDVNRDGFADLLIGAKGSNYPEANAGSAYVVYGPFTGDSNLSEASVKFHGSQNNEQTGTITGPAGDIDGDGLPEVYVGSPLTDTALTDVGRVSFFYGDTRL